jgi:hypothetical protein
MYMFLKGKELYHRSSICSSAEKRIKIKLQKEWNSNLEICVARLRLQKVTL